MPMINQGERNIQSSLVEQLNIQNFDRFIKNAKPEILAKRYIAMFHRRATYIQVISMLDLGINLRYHTAKEILDRNS